MILYVIDLSSLYLCYVNPFFSARGDCGADDVGTRWVFELMCSRVMIDVKVDIDLCCENFLAILVIEASHQSSAGECHW
jgi:hypothetical protein